VQATAELLDLMAEGSRLLIKVPNAKEPKVTLRPMGVAHMQQVGDRPTPLLTLDSTRTSMLNAIRKARKADQWAVWLRHGGGSPHEIQTSDTLKRRFYRITTMSKMRRLGNPPRPARRIRRHSAR